MSDDPTNLTLGRLRTDLVSAFSGLTFHRFRPEDRNGPDPARCPCGQVADVYGLSLWPQRTLAIFCDGCIATVTRRSFGI